MRVRLAKRFRGAQSSTNSFAHLDALVFLFTAVDPAAIPDHDLLYGGLNCAPFSKIGIKLGLKDKRANVFWQFMLVAAIKKPKVCIIENVANLIKSNKCSNFNAISTIAKLIGYKLQHSIRNAKDFVRSDRLRCFIIMVRADIAEEAGMPEVPPPIQTRMRSENWL